MVNIDLFKKIALFSKDLANQIAIFSLNNCTLSIYGFAISSTSTATSLGNNRQIYILLVCFRVDSSLDVSKMSRFFFSFV